MRILVRRERRRQAAERTHRLNVVERYFGAGIGQVYDCCRQSDAQHNANRERPPQLVKPEDADATLKALANLPLATG